MDKLRSEALIDGGKVFNAVHYFTGIGASAAVYLHLKTPPDDNLGRRVVLDFQAVALQLSAITLFENPTLSGDGTVVTPHNMNRNKPDDTDVEVYHTPGVTADGTTVFDQMIPAASSATLASDSYDTDREWVLKPDESYLLKVTNLTGNASAATIVAMFRKATVN